MDWNWWLAYSNENIVSYLEETVVMKGVGRHTTSLLASKSDKSLFNNYFWSPCSRPGNVPRARKRAMHKRDRNYCPHVAYIPRFFHPSLSLFTLTVSIYGIYSGVSFSHILSNTNGHREGIMLNEISADFTYMWNLNQNNQTNKTDLDQVINLFTRGAGNMGAKVGEGD